MSLISLINYIQNNDMFKWFCLAPIQMRYFIKSEPFLSFRPFKKARRLPESILKVTISSDDNAVPFNEILISNFMDFVSSHIWLVHIFTAYFNETQLHTWRRSSQKITQKKTKTFFGNNSFFCFRKYEEFSFLLGEETIFPSSLWT